MHASDACVLLKVNKYHVFSDQNIESTNCFIIIYLIITYWFDHIFHVLIDHRHWIFMAASLLCMHVLIYVSDVSYWWTP